MKRIVVIIAVGLLLCAALPVEAFAINARVHYVKWYSQRDPAWAGDRMGSGCLLKNSGCLVASVAMVMKYMYHGTDPGAFNRWLNRNGGYAGCSLRWSKINQYSSGKTYVHKDIKGCNWSLLREELKRGFPVIAEVRLSGRQHWIVIRGWERVGGRDIYYINDPWDTRFSVKTLASYGNRVYRMVTFRTKYFPPHNVMHADCIWRNGGTPNVGRPFNNYHYWRHAWVRDYRGGRYGWDIIMYWWNSYFCGVPKAYLLRCGFFEKYRQIAGPYSKLGYPLDEEYPSAHYGGRARQDFSNGYMVWYGNRALVYSWTGTVMYRAPELPTKDEAVASISQVAPNPFSDVTTIRFNLNQQQIVSLGVHDIQGRAVSVLVDEIRPAGEHEVVWSRVNDQGNKVSAGVYFVTLTAGSARVTKKVIVK